MCKFTALEINYVIYDKEVEAIIFVFEKLRPYLAMIRLICRKLSMQALDQENGVSFFNKRRNGCVMVASCGTNRREKLVDCPSSPPM